MKRSLAVLSILFASAALVACDDPEAVDQDMTEIPAEPAPDAMAADDAAVEAAAPSATETPPVDPGTLPADKRSSEESVQPESETLFY